MANKQLSSTELKMKKLAKLAVAVFATKVNTYTKAEVNGLVSPPRQNYVSVTATAQTSAATDILPASGSDDTIYRVGNWDGTQYNTAFYSEYAWYDGAYIHLDTKNIGAFAEIAQTLGEVAIDPNVLNVWGAGNDLAGLTVTFNQGTAGLINEYMMRIFVEHDNFSLSLPSGITWPYDEPDMERGYVYDISVIGGKGIYASWALENE